MRRGKQEPGGRDWEWSQDMTGPETIKQGQYYWHAKKHKWQKSEYSREVLTPETREVQTPEKF